MEHGLPANVYWVAAAGFGLGIGWAPPHRPVLLSATSCCDSRQASNSAALSAHLAGIMGALPDELLMPMQSSIARTAVAQSLKVR